MEEKILEIIQKNYNEFTGTNEAEIVSSSEIASHFREFIEWMFEKEFFYGTLSEGYLSTIHDTPKFNSINEVYNYWMKEVKK